MAKLDFDKEADTVDPKTDLVPDTELVDEPLFDADNEDESEEYTVSDNEDGADGEDTDFEALAASDLIEIRREFHEARALSSLAELDNPVRFAELRELGLSAREAYLATQKRRRTDNRSHLSGVAPRSASAPTRSMTASELSRARDLFSGMSDSEIQSLYKRVSRQQM